MKRNEWHCFPNNKKPKIYINKNSLLDLALQLYQPYSIKGYLAKCIFKIGRTPKIFPINNDLSVQKTLLDLDRKIVETLDEDIAYVNFSMGTAGPHQKITAQIIDKKDNVFCYVKVCQKEILGHLLENEKNALNLVKSNFSSNDFQVPQVLAWDNYKSQQMIFLSAAKHTKRSKLKLDRSDVTFLEKLHTKGNQLLSIDSYAEPVTAQLQTWNHYNSSTCEVLKKSVSVIKNLLPDAQFQTCFSHGDFTPWNTFSSDTEGLFVFDWEYFSSNRPLFYDLFHYVFMTEKLVNKASPEMVVKKLIGLWLCPLCNLFFREKNIYFENTCVYLLLYLIGQLTRPADNFSTNLKYLTECISITVSEIEKQNERKQILVAAYACESDVGSEPGVGWNWLIQIARNHDVTVITKANNKKSIEMGILENPQLSIKPVYVAVPKWISFWKKKQRGIRTYYYLWQFFAYLAARKLIKEAKFDIGHHVTFVNDWLWTFFALLPLPFIWGPIGSHPAPPKIFLSRISFRIKEAIRLTIQRTMRVLDPLFWVSAIRAKLVLGINADTGLSLPLIRLTQDKFLVEPAIGIEQVSTSAKIYSNDRIVKFLFVGRFVQLKNPVLALQAFAECYKECSTKNLELTMVGTGSEENILKSKVDEFCLQDSVRFISWVTRQEVMALMKESDVFLFPSFEGGGMVVLEAMASGLPVVCLNYGGPGEMVDESSGFLVSVDDYQETLAMLKNALLLLVDAKLRQRKGLAAKARAESYFSWDNKRVYIESVYKCLGAISIR